MKKFFVSFFKGLAYLALYFGIMNLVQDIELVKQTHDAAQSLMLREDVQAHNTISHALALFEEKSSRVVLT